MSQVLIIEEMARFVPFTVFWLIPAAEMRFEKKIKKKNNIDITT